MPKGDMLPASAGIGSNDPDSLRSVEEHPLPQPAPAFSNDHQLTGGQAAGSDGEEDSAASSSKPDSQKVSPRPRQPGYCKDL